MNCHNGSYLLLRANLAGGLNAFCTSLCLTFGYLMAYPSISNLTSIFLAVIVLLSSNEISKQWGDNCNRLECYWLYIFTLNYLAQGYAITTEQVCNLGLG